MPENDHRGEFADVDDDAYDAYDEDAFDEPYGAVAELDSTRPLMLTAVALQVLAAVLGVVAPFLTLWTLRAQDSTLGSNSVSSIDGWGNYGFTSASHGPRFGIVVTIAAAPLLVAALVRLREVILLSGRGPDDDDDLSGWQAEPARVAGVAGSALLLGGAATLALAAYNVVSVQDVSTRASGLSSPQVTIGAAVWVSLGAWVASAVALVLSEVAQRQVRRTVDWAA